MAILSWQVFLFVLVGQVPDQAHIMTGFVLVFIYMVMPLESLLILLPRANLAKVSAQRIEELTQTIPVTETVASTAPLETAQTLLNLRTLAFRDVIHRYYHEQSDDFFELGPINLDFQPGQITFLIGGNGSGKTTLAKLLVGLYPPEKGSVLLNGVPIDHTNRDSFRQLFSAIFSDFHLFDRLLESKHTNLDEAGNQLLTKLHLHHKVQVKEGAFTTTSLSQGQRKRLALVAAYLEDRPFLLFDEWAADQDPAFKNVFYCEVLPELKAAGKTVVVISHDDRYFHLADRIIRMESGRLIFDGVPEHDNAH